MRLRTPCHPSVLGASGGHPNRGPSLLAERQSRRAFDALQAAGLDARAFPAMGALCVGLAALEYPEITYQGWTNFNSVLLGGDKYNMFGFGANLLLQFAALKIVLTSNSRGREPRSVILKGKGRGSSGKNLYNTVFVDEGSEFPAEPEQAPYTGVYAPQYGAMKKFTKGTGVKASAGGSAGI